MIIIMMTYDSKWTIISQNKTSRIIVKVSVGGHNVLQTPPANFWCITSQEHSLLFQFYSTFFSSLIQLKWRQENKTKALMDLRTW